MFRRLMQLAGVATVLATGGAALATTTPTNIPNSLRDQAGSNAARDVLIRTDEALNSITYTYYSTLGVWKPWDGIYKVVCARFITNILNDAVPERLDVILDAADNTFPTLAVWEYYPFFRNIPFGSTRDEWKRITKVSDLRPGDLVVWKWAGSHDGDSWGHIVIVASKPERDTRWSGAYKVRVADSSRSGHSNDNRGATGSGVGAGEMLLRANSEGKVYNLAWTLKGLWRDDLAGMAMVRPAD